MKATDALLLTDQGLADLYSQWSEDFYCAGWLADGEADFVRWLLANEPDQELASGAWDIHEIGDDYVVESLAAIRSLLAPA
jgi:hypothetical protein